MEIIHLYLQAMTLLLVLTMATPQKQVYMKAMTIWQSIQAFTTTFGAIQVMIHSLCQIQTRVSHLAGFAEARVMTRLRLKREYKSALAGTL